jgi:DNA-binding NarL/FixJ family response regulator
VRMEEENSYLTPMANDRQLRILVADDQPYMRRAVKALLESQNGWVVCGEAADGLEAIQKTGELQPDVIVMDMIMPNLNGLEATRRIHREFPDTHVLILTLHDVPELIKLVQTAGAQGLVLKSDSNRVLILAVEHLCRTESFFHLQELGPPGEILTS